MFKKITDINVLIVEDNEVNQIVLKRILQLNKITNFIVNNGEDALTALHNNTFDVILMDIQLPIKNGIETTIEIRQLKDTKINKIPIIALTANG
ncbi:MAG: response regulator, partial [Chitinophagaceae bacterium]|nr:response regulator [Chitinophagaceae bacterium]